MRELFIRFPSGEVPMQVVTRKRAGDEDPSMSRDYRPYIKRRDGTGQLAKPVSFTTHVGSSKDAPSLKSGSHDLARVAASEAIITMGQLASHMEKDKDNINMPGLYYNKHKGPIFLF